MRYAVDCDNIPVLKPLSVMYLSNRLRDSYPWSLPLILTKKIIFP